jgi:hypothetical protein
MRNRSSKSVVRRYVLRTLGTFIVTSEPTVQLHGETTRGDRVDFDQALGGGDAQRVRLDSF